MSVIKYIFLGIVQGLTEFLPVSSSAHLLLFRNFLQIEGNRIFLEIVLHLGTLVALIVFLFKDIKLLWNRKIIFLIGLATGFTALVVIVGGDFLERMFFSTNYLALPLFITGLVLLGTKRYSQGTRTLDNLKISDAIWLGIVQGLAVIPGISRSGATVSVLLFRNVDKEAAFKFSFLAAILAILGALFFKISDFSSLAPPELKNMLFGFLASFFSGLLALKILLNVIRRAKLHLFGYYCLILALILSIQYYCR